MGVATGNFNTLSSMYLNPAHLGSCNERFGISLSSFNFALDNSLGKISSIADINSTVSTNNTENKNIFTYSTSEKFSMMLPMVELRGPTLLLAVNRNHTFALSSRFRIFNEFNNFNRSLYNAITDNEYRSQSTVSVTSSKFNWTAHMWGEYGLSWGALVADNGRLRLKLGATVRYLTGVGYIGLKGNNLDVTFTANSDSLYAANSDVQFSSSAVSTSSAVRDGFNTSNILGGRAAGTGLGLDAGFMCYLVRDEKSVAEYYFSFGGSVTDFGSINYAQTNSLDVRGNGSITGAGISSNTRNYDEFRNYALSKGFTADSAVGATRVVLPTSLILTTDIKLMRRVYINGTFAASLANLGSFGSRYYNHLTITPRFDAKIFSFALPVTFNMLTNNMRMGVGIRLYTLFLGSDDMMTLISGGYGVNFYAGGMFPLYRKPRVPKATSPFLWRY